MEYAVFYPAILSSLVVIVASYRSWSTTVAMIRLFIPAREHEVSTAGPSSSISGVASLTLAEMYDYYSRMDIFTKNTVWRMLLTPMLYIGVLVGCMALIYFGNTFESEILALAIVKVVPALNTVLWIWADDTVMSKWKNWMVRGVYADTRTLAYADRTSDDGSRASGMLRSDMSSNPLRDSSMHEMDQSISSIASFFNPLFPSLSTKPSEAHNIDEVNDPGRSERVMSGNEEL